ncbi:hypothetical protein [Salinicoccus luteus]|uniref:aldose epimerase family protein n=1 Tax=Salinicoccus luteus TaxID=367840 RepID=UPI0004E1167F|nr:hypothetical protein [Salinicoccus luteus]
MNITERILAEGIKEYTLKNDVGMSVSVINIGAAITGIHVPDKKGEIDNVVVAYKDIEDYIENPDYLGAVIGPLAGRVTDAKLKIRDEVYHFRGNEGQTMLHSGEYGVHNDSWSIDDGVIGRICSIKMSCRVDGYPGHPLMSIIYTLDNENRLSIDYKITVDSATIISPTNHTYFNLSGNDGTGAHIVNFGSKSFHPLNEQLLPLEKKQAEGIFDLSSPTTLQNIYNDDHLQIKIASSGFDHYFYLENKRAVLTEPISGRRMTMTTTFPGMIFYTGNAMESKQCNKNINGKHAGVCFEAQEPPILDGLKISPERTLDKRKYERKTTFEFSLI